jgi:hypothetical protein
LASGPRPSPSPWLSSLGTAFGCGFVAEPYNRYNLWPHAIILTIAIMHFRYDGFVWSVRRKEV